MHVSQSMDMCVCVSVRECVHRWGFVCIMSCLTQGCKDSRLWFACLFGVPSQKCWVCNVTCSLNPVALAAFARHSLTRPGELVSTFGLRTCQDMSGSQKHLWILAVVVGVDDQRSATGAGMRSYHDWGVWMKYDENTCIIYRMPNYKLAVLAFIVMDTCNPAVSSVHTNLF